MRQKPQSAEAELSSNLHSQLTQGLGHEERPDLGDDRALLPGHHDVVALSDASIHQDYVDCRSQTVNCFNLKTFQKRFIKHKPLNKCQNIF